MIERPDLIVDLKLEYQKSGIADWEEINIFGIRFEENQQADVFNDWLGIVSDTMCYLVPGTTDPGKYWTENKEGGAAHLCLGWHKAMWVVDTHAADNPAFAHQALCQRPQFGCLPCTIWRDVDRDYIEDSGDRRETGFFGINFHRASALRVEQSIGYYSAGCQVVQSKNDFSFILSIIKGSELFRKDKKHLFGYFLLNRTQVPM